MTNDEIRRNDEIRMTKPAIAQLRAFPHSGFGFLSSFVIRHSSLNPRVVTLGCFLIPGLPTLAVHSAEVIETDVCVYGGTSAGVAAAVQTTRMGKRAIIVESGRHLGGLSSGGLGATDIGNKSAIGGISREFYARVAQHYANDAAWVFESRESYFRQRLASLKKEGARIVEIAMQNRKVFRARMFVDATYEGDLMAKAGVSYFVGREANSHYGETLSGIRAETPKHQFIVPVDPYRKPGDPNSGPLPFIQPGDGGNPGEGDHRVQTYNFRLCFTTNAENRAPIAAPPNYDPAQYELFARYLEALVGAGKKPKLSEFWNPIWMPNGKTDINNNGGFSTDFIGANFDYPDADYSRRAQIWREHEDYTRGFVCFLATSPRVPENIRKEMQTWGPAKDEFVDTGNWPHQIYVREARRMISDYVMTERNCRGQVEAEDSIGLAAYTMDSHNCRRIVKDGNVENEGDVQVGGYPPYPISYRAIVPKAAECENLLVPICLSATHIAYGSIRMEPVFMILGQSAATAAALAIDGSLPLQKVGYHKLRVRLLDDKQILEWHTVKPG